MTMTFANVRYIALHTAGAAAFLAWQQIKR
jgi:hypothetical protein